MHHPSFFFFNDTATTEIYTLSLHDALPISHLGCAADCPGGETGAKYVERGVAVLQLAARSGEHTSELQSPCNLVCRLLLEKKKKKPKTLTVDGIPSGKSCPARFSCRLTQNG